MSTIATGFVFGSLLQRARHAVGGPVTPSRVEFAGAAPRSRGELAEVLRRCVVSHQTAGVSGPIVGVFSPVQSA